jgi:PAS domain S-box-containing protein
MGAMYLKNELYELMRSDESIFDFIQNSSLDGLWYWDLENPENEWMNARFWTVLGYNPDEMPHKSNAWQSIINHDDLKVANNNFIKHCEDPNYPYDQLVRYTHKNGSTKWIRCRGLAIRDKNGKPIRMLGAHQDVSEIKNSEQELLKAKETAEENERKFRNSIENSPIPTVISENEGKLPYLNKQFVQTYGYTLHEIPTLEKWFELAYPDAEYRSFVLNDWRQEVEKSVKNNVPTGFKEYSVTCKNGEIKTVAISAYFENDITIALFQDITERKQIELELAESVERYKSLHNASFGGIAIHDKGMIIECNQGLSEMTGYALGELIGMDSLLLIAEEHREMVMNKIVTGFEKPYEANGLRKNGEQFPMRIEARNVPYKGKIVRTVEFRDITESKKAEEALLKSEAKLNALFASMSEMVVLHELVFNGKGKPVDYRIIDCNDAYTKITGITRNAALGRLSTEVYGTVDPPYFNEFSKVALTGEPYHYEAYFQPMDKYFSISVICPEKNRFATVTTDITERKLAELLLQDKNEEIAAQNEELNQANIELIKAKEKAVESEERFLLAMKASHDGLFDWNLITNEIFYSVGWKKMLGYEDHELPNDFSIWERTTSREDVKKSWELQQKLISKQVDRFVMEFKMKHKDGHWVDILSRAEAIFNESGKAVRIVGTHTDITGRKQAEQLLQDKNEEIAAQNEVLNQTNQELIAAKEKAEESDRLKSAFLANMSHEIRTPMNGILGFADLLKEPGLSGEEQQAYINIIEKSGNRLLNIINQIVDISKIEAGLMEMDIAESNINDHIDYVYTFFKPEAEAKNISLSFKSPLSAQEATIKTDREKLYAILINLVKNAIKYTHNGSIELGYKIVETQCIASLQFYVKDTGIGIPKDRQDAIFERFIKADIADKMAYQGAGLGLAISKAYVEMLDGKIWVESEEGKGSIFYFTLPYNTNNNEHFREAFNRQTVLTEKTTPVRRLKILIVEDDEVSEMLIESYIKMFGKDILKARTGFEAVEVCRDNPDIDLIMMDICMPEMGGYEATKQIRKFNKETIIIAQTAYALTGDREKAIESGCNAYITKPINKTELQALIQKYFENKFKLTEY